MRTRWVVMGVPGRPRGLDVTLEVDTDAAVVVEAIEEAARRNGIDLTRLDEYPDGPLERKDLE